MNIINCPLRVPISKKKDFILNINNYRNAHYRVLDKAKKQYFLAVKSQISRLPGWKRVKVKFTVYPRDRRKFDIANVTSIHNKFLLDAIVQLGKLPDDNYLYHVGSSDSYGRIDKNNPRVEAEFIDMDTIGGENGKR